MLDLHQRAPVHGMCTGTMYMVVDAARKPFRRGGQGNGVGGMPELERAVLWAGTGSGEVSRIISSCRFHPRIQAFTKLITLCGRSGDAAKALEVFECMREMKAKEVKPNAYSYSALIFALSNGGMWKEALAAFEEMKVAAKTDPSCTPSLISYSSAISACEKGHRADIAMELYHEMVQAEIQPDRVLFLSLLEVCIQQGEWKNAGNVLESMHGYGYAASNRIYKAFLENMANERNSKDGLELFLTLQMYGQDPDADMCSLLMLCFVNDGRSDLAQELWQSMMHAGIEAAPIENNRA